MAQQLLAAVGMLLAVHTAPCVPCGSEDLVAIAAEAGVDPEDLEGAVNTTQLPPREYLQAVGELPAPAPRRRYEMWERLVGCEASGHWDADTGNGFAGGPQFAPGTWRSHGGTGNPAQADRDTQIDVAERVLDDQGVRAWPICGPRTGLHR